MKSITKSQIETIEFQVLESMCPINEDTIKDIIQDMFPKTLWIDYADVKREYELGFIYRKTFKSFKLNFKVTDIDDESLIGKKFYFEFLVTIYEYYLFDNEPKKDRFYQIKINKIY